MYSTQLMCTHSFSYRTLVDGFTVGMLCVLAGRSENTASLALVRFVETTNRKCEDPICSALLSKGAHADVHKRLIYPRHLWFPVFSSADL